MRWSLRNFLLLPVLTCLLVAGGFAASAGGDDWRPIDPAELTSKTPTVEKDADAEVIFWDVSIDDSSRDLVLNHYVRMKIFNERGRDTHSKVQIPFGDFYGEEVRIKDVAARTIKGDGTIIELNKDDVFETTQVKVSGAKVKVKAFAVPGIEAGAVIEYRWRELRTAASANRMHLDYQRDVPAQRVTYHVRPSARIVGAFRIQMLNGALPPAEKEKDGFYAFTMTNVPAFHEEPYMPPLDQVREWLFVYYTIYRTVDPAPYWRDHAKSMYERSSELVKVDDEVRRAAAEAVGNATTPVEKVRKIFDYSRERIKNVNDQTLGLKPEERAKMKENKTPSDTLKHGIGTGTDIDHLFAALCIAAGLDARRSAGSDRGRIFFKRDFSDSYFLRSLLIAVKLDDKWVFFEPANRYVSFGMLRWQQEGLQALLADASETVWVKTQTSDPEKSLEKRTANLTLSDDGTLEGDVKLEFTGHLATELKEVYDDKSDSEREKALIDGMKARLSTAEVAKAGMENVTDMTKPLIFSYHVKVPGYAQRTGKRLFVQPGFFTHGTGPLFKTNERRNDIYFHYGWSEQDEVSIQLPAGYALDSPDAPTPITPEMTAGISSQTITIGISSDNRHMVYKRRFFFGGGGNILFGPEKYPSLKQLFEMIQKANDHTITLKQAAN